MSVLQTTPVARRGFLFRLSQAAAGLSALATPSFVSAADNDPDAWIGRLSGKQRVMLHVHQYFMTALVDARNMLANARNAWGVAEGENSLAILTHGVAIQGLLRDELWQQHSLGAFYKVNDPKTGAPSTRNFYLTAQDGEPADASVSDLMKRGVTFVVCDVALKNLAKKLSPPGQDPEALHAQLAAGVVPGAYVVPDLFVAMTRAQGKGVGYLFTDRSR